MVRNSGKSTYSLAIEQFCEDLNSLVVSPEKVATYLGLSADELAEAAQTDPSAMRHQPSSPEIQRLLRDIVRILSVASAIFESNDSAVRWLVNEKISAFRGA